MHFLNSPTNEGNENWNIVEPTLAAWADTPQVREYLSFKQRVERYVIDGGEFLLPLPVETNDKNSIGLGSTAKTRSAFGRPIIVGAIRKVKVFSQQQSNCKTRTSRYELVA